MFVVYDSIIERFFVHQILGPNILNKFFIVNKLYTYIKHTNLELIKKLENSCFD